MRKGGTVSMRKRILSLLAAAAAAMSLSVQAAEEPYRGYIYDSYGNSVESLNCYEPAAVLTGALLGTTNFSSPQDIFVDEEKGTVYLLDSGNGRVSLLSEKLELMGSVDRFTLGGEETKLKEPSSLFVTKEGEMLIADTGNERVLVCSPAGEVRQVLAKPDNELYPQDIRFAPKRVVADRQGNIYVIVTGLYQGAALFHADGTFERFYGSNDVGISAALLWDYFWKQIMSTDQKTALSRYVPAEFTGFDIDEDGFVYTVTQDSNNKKMLRKLNFLGESVIYTERTFGDLESEYDKRSIITRFYDVCVDRRGNTFALDLTRGHIFQYNTDFKLVSVFGSLGGEQAGTFKLPCAVDSLEDRILVLDSDRAALTVFSPTAFGKKVLAALELYEGGYYNEALEPWREILTLNENYYLAYQGIADGQYMLGQYKEAMESYRLAADRSGYLKAFREYRNIRLRESFLLVFAFVVLVMAGAVAVIQAMARRRRRAAAGILPQRRRPPNKMLYSLRVFLSPAESFEEMKEKRLFSVPASFIILLLFFLSAVFSYTSTGFGFNENDPRDLNTAVLLASTIGLFVLWSLSNYLFCTLHDGKGFFKEIWCASAYALLPYTLLTFLVTAASNFVVLEEYAILRYLGVAGILWSGVLLISAMRTVHAYSIPQTLGSILLTLVGVLIAVFLLVLSFTVYNQVVDMIAVIVRELLFRL